MIDHLITSKTRIKLLLKFFLNPSLSSYLRELESEFQDSSNSIRIELNRLEEANMLIASKEGRKKKFSVNQKHPLFGEIQNIVRKHFELDLIIDRILNKIGNLDSVFLTGSISNGIDDKIIDLVLVGDVHVTYLVSLIEKSEYYLKRKIRYIIYTKAEFEALKEKEKTGFLLLWESEE